MAATAERVKQLLFSFLSSSSAENRPQEPEPLETDDRNEAPNGYTPKTKQTICPQDQDAYFERVSSYSSTTWFAKPVFLSPLVCARYGWVNVDKDMLKCVTCKAHVSGHLPSSSKPSVVSACYSRFSDQLRTGHKPVCPWGNYPSPEYFAEIHLNNSSEAVNLFRERCLRIVKVKQNLPVLKKRALNEMGLNEGLLNALVHLCSNWPEDCEEEHKVVAVVLSLTGWLFMGKTSTPLVRCLHCNREVGLWNFQCFCHPPQTPDPEDTIPQPPITNGHSENDRLPSETVQNSQDTNTSTSQDSNGSNQTADSVAVNLETVIRSSEAADVVMPVDEQDSSSEDSNSESRSSPMKAESSPQQIDSPDMDAESSEPISGVISGERDPKVYDVEGNIGAMGDGFYAHLLNSDESRESADQAYYNNSETVQDIDSSEDSNDTGELVLSGVQGVSSSEEEQDESRDANEEDEMDQDQNGEREESRECENTNESGSSYITRSFDSSGRDSHTVEQDYSGDEEVPPGGVDVSGDDSDVEIVIMDSSDEDQSQEQANRGIESDESGDEESESEEDDDVETELANQNDGQFDDSGSESEREEQRGGGWGEPGGGSDPEGEQHTGNLSVEQISEGTGEEEHIDDISAEQEPEEAEEENREDIDAEVAEKAEKEHIKDNVSQQEVLENTEEKRIENASAEQVPEETDDKEEHIEDVSAEQVSKTGDGEHTARDASTDEAKQKREGEVAYDAEHGSVMDTDSKEEESAVKTDEEIVHESDTKKITEEKDSILPDEDKDSVEPESSEGNDHSHKLACTEATSENAANGDEAENIQSDSKTQQSALSQKESPDKMSASLASDQNDNIETNMDSSASQTSDSSDDMENSSSGEKSPSLRSTGKHVCSGDEEETEPAKKRQRIQDPKRPFFHPLNEHRTWCPWSKASHSVNTSDKPTDVNSSPVCQSMSPYRNGTNQEPGWKKVLLMLLPELSPTKSLADIARTTPPHQSLRSLRQLFKQWESPVSHVPFTHPAAENLTRNKKTS